MVPESRVGGIALAAFCLLLLPSVGCAAAIQPFQSAYPEQLPSDSTPLYIWNEPLNIIILELVCISAPALFIPVQILFSLFAWLHLGHKRILCWNVLENQARNTMYTCVRENPGIHMRSLSRMLGMNIGTARYHMGMLCRTGKVTSGQNCRGMSYYVSAGTYPDLQKKIAGFLDERPKSRIINLVLQHPGSTRKDLASRLVMSGPSITWHMKPLIREGVVRSKKNGRYTRYYLNSDAKECIRILKSSDSCACLEERRQAPEAAVRLRRSADTGG
jgi:predicted transcriptional regulator